MTIQDRDLQLSTTEQRRTELEADLMLKLMPLAARILEDCPEQLRKEHQSKTYCILAAIGLEAGRRRLYHNEPAPEFVALGKFRTVG